jgi:hypothetical protein
VSRHRHGTLGKGNCKSLPSCFEQGLRQGFVPIRKIHRVQISVRQWTRRWIHTRIQVRKNELVGKHYSLPCVTCLTYIFNYELEVGRLFHGWNSEPKCPSKVGQGGLRSMTQREEKKKFQFMKKREIQEMGGGVNEYNLR